MPRRPAADATASPSPLTHGPLAHLEEQLWRPAVRTGDARLSLSPATGGWREAEAYLVLPTLSRATMLLPAGPRAATTGALLNYRGLRRPAQNLQRATLGAAARTGVRLPFPRLAVQVRGVPGVPGPEPVLPLALLAAQTGSGRLHASIGIRTGANRKATLQLVDDAGVPAGFAKFAWNDERADDLARERRALEQAQGSDSARTPPLLATGSYYDWPFIVTAPLPSSSRGVRGDVPPPNPQELYGVCPLVRWSAVAATGQFAALRRRVDALPAGRLPGDLLGRLRRLVDAVAARGEEIPVTSRWHGDLTPWNLARDGDGVLWCFDWESSEPDAVAGLDALHWELTVRTERGARLGRDLLREAYRDAAPFLVAAGVPRAAWPSVLAVYAATLSERACALGAGTGGWEESWVLPSELTEVVEEAHRLVEEHR